MILRAVLAVALATAVVGLALPLSTDAASHRADAAATRASERVADAVDELAESDVVRGPGAREYVSLSLPEGPLAGVRAVAVGGVPGDGDGHAVVAYRLDGGGWRFGARLALPACADACGGPPLVVGADGTLTLGLGRSSDGRVVRVATREFKAENGTSPRHARPARVAPANRPRLRV